jgi:hypothetical protein
LAELTFREVISLAINPVIKVISRGQTRLQQFAAKKLVNQQCGNVALPSGWVRFCPLARRRHGPRLAQTSSDVLWLELHFLYPRLAR